VADEEQQEEAEELPADPPFDFAEGWPPLVERQVAQVFTYDPEVVQGKPRLGDLSFDEAPEQLRDIRSCLRDLSLEPWEELDPALRDEHLSNQLQQLIDLLEAMTQLSPTDPNVHGTRDQHEQSLNAIHKWFQDHRQYARRAFFDRRAAEREASLPTHESVAEAADRLHALERQAKKLESELAARSDLISAMRQASGESAGEDLGGVLQGRATELGEAAQKWFLALIGTSVGALVGAILTFLILKPGEKTESAADLGELGLGLFIVGLLVFSVRVCAQNYRVNRHLQAIAKSKAAALGTFTRLTAAIEDQEIRSAVTLALAQAIFATEETGLVDSSGDHVTLVERAMAPLVRSSPPAGSA
jgi:hypothetical protein